MFSEEVDYIRQATDLLPFTVGERLARAARDSLYHSYHVCTISFRRGSVPSASSTRFATHGTDSFELRLLFVEAPEIGCCSSGYNLAGSVYSPSAPIVILIPYNYFHSLLTLTLTRSSALLPTVRYTC